MKIARKTKGNKYKIGSAHNTVQYSGQRAAWLLVDEKNNMGRLCHALDAVSTDDALRAAGYLVLGEEEEAAWETSVGGGRLYYATSDNKIMVGAWKALCGLSCFELSCNGRYSRSGLVPSSQIATAAFDLRAHVKKEAFAMAGYRLLSNNELPPGWLDDDEQEPAAQEPPAKVATFVRMLDGFSALYKTADGHIRCAHYTSNSCYADWCRENGDELDDSYLLNRKPFPSRVAALGSLGYTVVGDPEQE